MFDAEFSPYQEVGIGYLGFLSVIVPLTLIVCRNYVWELVINRLSRISNSGMGPSTQLTRSWKYNMLLTWEVILGILTSWIFQGVMVDLLKEKVGFMRPNGQALEVWTQVHSTLRKDWAITAHRSFPSGHSSWVKYISLKLDGFFFLA